MKRILIPLDGSDAAEAETHVLVADSAARGLHRHCRETEIEAIALSTHGRGGVPRLLLGSVADKLIRGAGVPILVNRRPRTGE